MKKIITALYCAAFIASFSGCQSEKSANSDQSSQMIDQTEASTEEAADSTMVEKFFDIDYDYDNTSQTLTIYGKGQMNWDFYTPEYRELETSVVPKKLVISPGITKIQDGAFAYSCDGNSGEERNHFNQIEMVVLPDSLTEIGSSSFDSCKGLKSISIPQNVKKVGEFAFWLCSSLETVDIPEGITVIGGVAFSECNSLKSITFPSTLVVVKESVCSQCEQLTNVVVKSGITKIQDGAFYFCPNLKNVELGDTITSIGDFAFFGSNELKSVTIPKSVKTIGEEAFGYHFESYPNTNDDYNLDDYSFEHIPVKDFTIYGYKNTAAEKYAQENDFIFVALDGSIE